MSISKEIFSDQGPNFISALHREVKCMTSYMSRAFKESTHHTQIDRLTKHFNGTLKSMLRNRKFVNKTRKYLDEYIPTCCSHIGLEVPQKSTGFLLFELLYVCYRRL